MKNIIYKIKDSKMSMEEKYSILNKLRTDEISINYIKYLSLSGYCGYRTRSGRPDEQYILIGSLLKHFEDKPYYREENIGIWLSGIVYYRELIIENGEMIYREEIKP